MQTYGNTMAAGGGYGGDHKTPLPTLKFREKPAPLPSPTALRFPSDVPADKVVRAPSRPYNAPNRYSRKGQAYGPRDQFWVSPLAIDQERIDVMVVMYEGGYTMAKIAEKLGCSRATVAKYLDDQGVEIRKPRKKPLDLKAIKARLDSGESIRRVAKANHVSASTLMRRLEEEYPI